MLRHLHDKKAVLHALGWIFMTSANSFAPRAICALKRARGSLTESASAVVVLYSNLPWNQLDPMFDHISL